MRYTITTKQSDMTTKQEHIYRQNGQENRYRITTKKIDYLKCHSLSLCARLPFLRDAHDHKQMQHKYKDSDLKEKS